MHSLEGIVKLNSPEVSNQVHKNARALNLGSANAECPKSTEKTGLNHSMPDPLDFIWKF